MDKEEAKILRNSLYCFTCGEIKDEWKIINWESSQENTKATIMCDKGHEKTIGW